MVKFKVGNIGSDGSGCFRIKVMTHVTQFADMKIAELWKWWDLIGEGKMCSDELWKWWDLIGEGSDEIW